MKKLFYFFFLFCFCATIHAQNSKTGIIYYNHIDNHYGVSYNSYLLFNQNKSHYVTAKDSLGLTNQKNTQKDEKTVSQVEDFNDVSKTRKNGFQVYLDNSKDSIYFSNAFTLLSKVIYAKEKIPNLSWQLVNETKKIGNFLCKKAVAKFRGREYFAWYTEQIPLSYGPWKLQGLPGLILEAETKDGFLKIFFKKIKYPEQNLTIPASENSVLTKGEQFISLEEYKGLQRKRIEKTYNSLKIAGKKYGIKTINFDEKDNFLEIFKE